MRGEILGTRLGGSFLVVEQGILPGGIHEAEFSNAQELTNPFLRIGSRRKSTIHPRVYFVETLRENSKPKEVFGARVVHQRRATVE